MQNSKLVELLSELTISEQNQFIKFVKSPYYNSNSTLEKLSVYLIEKIRKKDNDGLEKTTIWQHIHPTEAFNYGKLRSYASLIINFFDSYQIAENIKNDNTARHFYLLNQSVEKNRSSLKSHAVKSYLSQNRSQNEYSSRTFMLRYLSENIMFEHFIENTKRYTDSNINLVISTLVTMFYSEFLKQLASLKARDWEDSNISNQHITFIINEIESNHELLKNSPSIEIYYRIYRTMVYSDDIDNFYELKNILKTNAYNFEKHEAKNFYTAALNYCISRMNKGDTHFINEIFDIYKDFLSSELIFEDDQLHEYNFKNIVTTGLRLKEYDWVEYFIDTYSDRVPEEQRKNTVAYNSAQLNFYRGRFEKVLSLLQEVEYDDLTYNLGAKSMMIATYYELSELDPLYSMLDSFKVYLSRKQNKIPADFRVLYTNLIKFVKQLLQIRQGEVKKIDKLIEDIRKAGSVASMNWLIDKANEMR